MGPNRISNPNIITSEHFAPRPAACAEDKHAEIANIAPQKRRARASGPYEAPKATARLPRGLQRAGRAGGAMGRNTAFYLLTGEHEDQVVCSFHRVDPSGSSMHQFQDVQRFHRVDPSGSLTLVSRCPRSAHV